MSDIAIIGMSAIYPKAPDLKGFWHLMRAGVDGIGELPDSHWKAEDYFNADAKAPDMTYCKRGGFLEPHLFDPTEFSLPPNTLEATDTSQLLGLVAAKAALEDAGYGAEREFSRETVSVIIGVTGTLELVVPLGGRLGHPMWRKAMLESGLDTHVTDEVMQRIGESMVGWQENSFPGLLGNVVAGRIANRLDLHGTNCVVDAACASSLSAAHLAMMELATGKADMVITGGADTFNDIFMFMCFSKTPALSPSGKIRPFADASDGTLIGEGLGMVVFKRLSDAKRDGDRVYAVIKGLGSASDGNSGAVYAPSSPGQARAIRRAYENAGVDPRSIALIEAHGTGTKVGDVVEFEGLREVFGPLKEAHQWCAMGTIKSQIGHTKAAAGAASLIKTALALHFKVFPPTLGVEKPNAKLRIEESPFYLNTVARPWVAEAGQPRRAALSSFGFGGTNFHMVLEEAESERPEVGWDGSVQILAFSDASLEGLRAKLKQAISPERIEQARFAAESRVSFDAKQPHRLLLVWDTEEPLQALLDKALEKFGTTCSGPEVFYRESSEAGKVVFMFPGQGSQYVNMGRELACVFPEFLDSLQHADLASPGLSARMYPPPTFTDETREGYEKALTATDRAQPALGAMNRGMFEILKRFGVAPEFTCGHSYGELCALYAAGSYDTATLNQLSALRGQLMAKGDGGRGGMAAVTAPIEKVEALIAELKLDVVVANRNSPSQCVLSGTKEAVKEAVAKLKEHGVRGVPLQVGAAFHSSLVASAEQPFRDGLEKASFGAGTVPVVANRSAEPYPADAGAARDLLAKQLVSQVNWVGQVEYLYAQGGRTFVEVGPKNVLTKLTGAILKGKAHQCVTLDGSGGKTGLLDLARGLADLASLGIPVQLSAWEVCPPPARKRRMTVPITGANYRNPSNGKHLPVREANSIGIKSKTPAAAATVAPATNGAAKPVIARIEDKPVNPKPTPAQQPPEPAWLPNPNTANPPPVLREAMQNVQTTLLAMQGLQQQTAQTHQKFLEGQMAAQNTFQMMVEGQQRMMESLFGGGAPSQIAYTAPARPAVAAPRPAAPAPRPVAPAPRVAAPAPRPIAPAPRPAAPVVAAPKPAPVAAPVARAGAGHAEIAEAVLSTVAEKTGYPKEMVNLEMDLEADLGIDSIKRVEILAAVEERIPGLAKVDPDKMGSLRTLGQIVEAFAPAATAPVAQQPSKAGNNDVAHKLLGVVAEKTGYPREMLNLEMDLEADLGIDSIKRVEILAAVEEAVQGLPKIDPDKMGSLRTLGQIVDAFGGSAPPAPTAGPSSGGGNEERLLSVVAEKTGYPREMLNLDMDLEADLGIDSIKRVEILAALEDGGKIGSDQVGSLRTLRQVLDSLGKTSAPPEPTPVGQPSSSVSPRLERRVLQAVAKPHTSKKSDFKIAAGRELVVVDDQTKLAPALVEALRSAGHNVRLGAPNENTGGLIFVSAGLGGEDFLRHAFQLTRQSAAALQQAAKDGGALLASICQMDGRFGLSGKIAHPMAGGLTGLPKTAAHEWVGVRCKALDVDPAWSDLKAAAQAVVDELGLGTLEVGLTAAARTTLDTVLTPLELGQHQLQTGDVVLVTGGARGVTAACAIALAKAMKPTLVLCGRSALPTAEPAWLQGLTVEGEIKRAILSNHFAGQKATPKDVAAYYHTLQANREVSQTIASIEAAGARVLYRSVDVRDPGAIVALVDSVRTECGPIKGLIHAAGVLADKRIEEKTDEMFESVFATKLRGYQNLMQALAKEPLKAVVLFSSVTARFGRPGQVDYCMANDVLNKLAQREAAARPNCRVVSLNWGPWAGGMVNEGLAREFGRLGIGLIPLDAGAQALVNELSVPPGGPVEILYGEGFPPAPGDVEVPEVAAVRDSKPLFETTASVESMPLLSSHLVGGRPIVPVALMVEWFAHAALHGTIGPRFVGFDNLKILRPLALEGGQPVTVVVMPAADGLELRPAGTGKAFSRTRVELALELPAAPEPLSEEGLTETAYPHTVAEIYADKLFHGPHLQMIRSIAGWSKAGMVAELDSSARVKDLVAGFARTDWLADPLALDGALQLGILWGMVALEKPSLPMAIGGYRQFQKRFPKDGVKAVLRIVSSASRKIVADVDFVDREGKLVARCTHIEWTADASLAKAFQRQAPSELGASMIGAYGA
jgi:acyl transferase domain-containing protein/NAD(P)-dependent dehydrogenase (short-subunit alcohol dehydrogenase family)